MTHQLSCSMNGRCVLRDVNFVAPVNQFVGLLGPNGSGKTSLLRCLYGGLSFDSGEVLIQNKPIGDYPRTQLARKVAVVLQHQAVNIALTVADVLRLGRFPHQRWFQWSEPDWSIPEQSILTTLDVGRLVACYFEDLSGGEKQRVLIARALIQQPDILILDEPTNHLDISHQLALMRLIKTLPITVICSLHDMHLASQFCDQLALMQEGRLVQQGTPLAVLTPARIKQVFNVDAQIDNHPQTGVYRLSFF